MTNKRKYITLISAIALAAALLFAYLSSNGFYGIGSDGENVQVEITEGMSGGTIAGMRRQE